MDLTPGASPLFAERLFRAVLELAVGLWMARHLAPVDYGNLSFALSVVALVGPIATMGLHGVLVRSLVAAPKEREQLLGTATALRLAAAFVVILLLLAVAGFLRHEDAVRATLIQIVSLGLLFQVAEVLDLSFQARGRMKASALARSIASALTSILRVALILGAAGVAAFAWTFVLELAVWAGLLAMIYRLQAGRLSSWRWSGAYARSLWHSSWPLMISGVGAVVNLKVDQVMLGAMVAPAELGIYSAAARLSEAVYFIPHVLAIAAFPGMIHARMSGKEKYLARLEKLCRLLVGLGVATAISGVIVGPVVLEGLLGSEFEGAGRIFRIHLLACVFIFPGVLLSRWLIAEDLTRFSITRHLSGAAVNVCLNALMIPAMGIEGAAISTVFSYAVASHISYYLTPQTRQVARMVTRSFTFPFHIFSRRGR